MGVKAVLMHQDDKLGSGQVSYQNTGVVFGDDGITGLLQNVPMAQNEWMFVTTGTQTRTQEIDATTKRIVTRVTAAVSSSETADLYRRVCLAKDHGSLVVNGFRVITRRHGTIVTATMSLFDPGGTVDAGVNAVSIKPVAADTFEQFQMTPTGVYAPNDFLTLKVDIVTDTATNYLDVCDIEMIYRNKRGNI